MKTLIVTALLSMFAFTNANATGTLSTQLSEGSYQKFGETKKEHYAVGLNVYEPVISQTLVYQSYTGTGDNHKYSGQWLTTKHQLDLSISKITVSPGFDVNYTSYDKVWDNEVFVKVGYKLW